MLSALTLAFCLAASAANAATVLITGSNRGIGLELAKQYAERGWTVIATSRSPADDDELKALDAKFDNLRVEMLDVADHAAIDALAAKLKGTPIDVLINNAGILGGGPQTQTIGKIDYKAMEEVHRINAIGPLKMSEAFLEHVAASDQKKIVVITSGTASLTNVRQGPFFAALYAYRMSKTAVNMAMRALSVELAPRGISVGILAPGQVETRLLQQAGNGGRGIDATTSVKGVMKNIDNLSPATTGQYVIYTGDTVPW